MKKSQEKPVDKRIETVAILVDGGFYRRRAYNLFGGKEPEDRAKELVEYCTRHLRGTDSRSRNHLYRIFYYDCPPIESPLWHPLLQEQVQMKDSEVYVWTKTFLESLANMRKLAIRLGELQEGQSGYRLKEKPMRKLVKGEITKDDLTCGDFEVNLVQKGVDMRIGLDIASLAYKKQVTQIVLISGDSDFVPAAKHARREGIDFILDPMWQGIRPELNKHIDGLHSCTFKHPTPETDKLCVKDMGKQAVKRKK